MRNKVRYYLRYPWARRRFPEIRGMSHRRYLNTFVPTTGDQQ